jgi:hypothetical protein
MLCWPRLLKVLVALELWMPMNALFETGRLAGAECWTGAFPGGDTVMVGTLCGGFSRGGTSRGGTGCVSGRFAIEGGGRTDGRLSQPRSPRLTVPES